MSLHRPHSPDFVAAWRRLAVAAFGWRTRGPFVIVPSLFGRVTLSYLPLLTYTDATPATLGELIARAEGASYLIRLLADDAPPFSPGQPVTLRLALAGRDAGAIWTGLRPECRNRVRKARRNGISLRRGRDPALIDDFHGQLARTLHRHGAPLLPRDFFARFPHEVEATYHVAYAAERPIAGLVAVRDGDLVWVPWVATDPEARPFCATDLLYWQSIGDAADAGATIFDFGRSPFGGGTHRFKAKWGAEPVALRWVAPRPIDVYRRFAAARTIWRAVPRPLTDRMGPKLCRYLPDY